MTQYTFPSQKTFLFFFEDYLKHHEQFCFKIDNIAQIYFLKHNLSTQKHSVLFLSSYHVVTSYGVRWWLQLVEEGTSLLHPHKVTNILDCVDYAGYATAALRLGQKNILFDPTSTQLQALFSKASELGANLLFPPIKNFDMTPLRYKID